MIRLDEMTRERFRELFRGFQYDPCMFTDMELYEKCRALPFDEAAVDRRFDKRNSDSATISFAVMLDDRVIGDLVLKNIDRESRTCELGIHLKDDSVKGRGYGTEAERLAIEYAFSELGMDTVYADHIVKNERSGHILDKLGFEFIELKDGFKKYRLDRKKI